MRNLKATTKLIIAVLCIVSLGGLYYGIQVWNEKNTKNEKFKKATFAAYYTQKLEKPSAKIVFNEEDGSVKYIYMLDSVGQPLGEWYNAGASMEPSARMVAWFAINYLKQVPGTTYKMDELGLIGEDLAKQYLQQFYYNYLYVYPLDGNSVLKAVMITTKNQIERIAFYNNFCIELSPKFNPWRSYHNAPELVREYMEEMNSSYEESSQLLSSHCQKACLELQEGIIVMGTSPFLTPVD